MIQQEERSCGVFRGPVITVKVRRTGIGRGAEDDAVVRVVFAAG